MTPPPAPDEETKVQAQKIISAWNETIEYSYGMSEDNHESLLPNLVQSVAAALDAAFRAGRAAGIEEAAKVAIAGSILLLKESSHE